MRSIHWPDTRIRRAARHAAGALLLVAWMLVQAAAWAADDATTSAAATASCIDGNRSGQVLGSDGCPVSVNSRADAFASVSQALTRGELAAARGGFSSADGFDFSFGLTQIQRVNGEPAIRQQLIRADALISRLRDGRASAGESNAVRRPVVLQRGAGNRIAPAVLPGRAGIPATIIQNSLDDQIIRNTRIYDFKLDHVRALTRRLDRSLGRAALRQRLVDSIR